MSRQGRLVVGTSGFSYPHWRENFYPPRTPQHRWLESYAERFGSVELNVTFYRLPTRDTFATWARRTPDDFIFVVKGSRAITHFRRLRDVGGQLEALLDACGGLGEKLACFLWQLPPDSAPDVAALDDFCALADERAAAVLPEIRLRHAFEFRDKRWFAEDVFAVLRERGCGLVLADPGAEGQPTDRLVAGFTYLRFHHGPRESGAYEDAELAQWADRARAWRAEGIDVFAYFNNDAGGWAPKNAMRFREMAGA